MFTYHKNTYIATYDGDKIHVATENGRIFSFIPFVEIHDLHEKDVLIESQIMEASPKKMVIKAKSSLWDEKVITVLFQEDVLKCYASVRTKNRSFSIDTIDYFKNDKEYSRGNYDLTYVPRFDWHASQVFVAADEEDSLSCQQWLSPPPFCYGLKKDGEYLYCGVGARQGEYNFISYDYKGSIKGAYFQLDYEGHTLVEDTFTTPHLILGPGQDSANGSIESYIHYLRKANYLPEITEKFIPSWWREPIFCGWGEMRYDYRKDHDGQENGTFINVTRYATEATFRHYMDVMDEKQVNPGTIIIDMGWAENPALGAPSKRRWINMRKFIDEQHDLGRKVLLWYTPVVTKGLPVEACMTLKGKPLAPDPTNPLYQEILKEEIRLMLSSDADGLNADGFKIDFTQNTPSEKGRFRNYLTSFWGLIQDDDGSENPYVYPSLSEGREKIQTYGKEWGVEILRKYIELIYTNMKTVKKDSVLITHTANPYFADIVDILRLNDLDGECDNVLDIMQNRFEISKMCNKYWLIDTDNDLMYDKDKWRDYIELQPKLGIPDTYYITAIATSMETFEDEDYDLLKRVWSQYRERVKVE